MKKVFRLSVIFAILISSCKTTSYTPSGRKITRQEYIAQYAPIAMKEMQRTGIPASIKLAQGILESGDGNSRLAVRANNHFGIKCHDWKGRRIYHDDDERGECFRRYRSADDSFKDHSDFLTGRSRYAFLFDLSPTDYAAWAAGLKRAGYATHPDYDRLLIRIIEENQLFLYDTGKKAQRRMQNASQPVKYPSREISSRLVEVRNHIKYIVAKEGDTYAGLAKELGLMAWELPKYNESEDERILQEGEIVYLQPKRNRAERGNDFHVVQEGETLYQISQLYGVKLERLLRMNSLNPGDEVETDDKVWLRKNKPESEENSQPVKIEFEL
jgi:hypothetical protein